MPRTPRWTVADAPHGIAHVKLSSWKYFDDYIRQEMLDYRKYIWRGQRCAPWPLEPTLDRALRRLSKSRQVEATQSHLAQFKYATRGRRGQNPPVLESENDWWALGQHHGLKTPLLDWTASPFIAAYFAFVGDGPGQTSQRAVFALGQTGILLLSSKIATEHKVAERASIIEFVRPMSDENDRLVQQAGLFTRAPLGVDLESWLASNLPADELYCYLLKITIPNKDRLLCLRSLNRMNINHLTLFPDLYGTSKFCNTDLQIKDY